jgi:hypothetical protein
VKIDVWEFVFCFWMFFFDKIGKIKVEFIVLIYSWIKILKMMNLYISCIFNI